MVPTLLLPLSSALCPRYDPGRRGKSQDGSFEQN
jgi:hypothetical protein